MKLFIFPVVYLSLGMCLLTGKSAQAAITTIDMTTADSNVFDTTSFGGLDFGFSTTAVGSSGTGLIDSFIRIQAIGDQEGYNSDKNSAEFDEKQGTRSTLISEFQTGQLPTEGGGTDTYAEIVLDATDGDLLSLNQIQIFAATESFATSPTLTSNGTTDTTNGFPIISFDTPETVEVFRLSDEAEEFIVSIDTSLGSGSGTFDLRFFFDVDILASLGSEYTHLIMYSQFGSPPGTDPSSSGFEEWAIALGGKSAFIPEPSTWALLMLSACGALFFQYRHQRKLKLAAAEAGDAE